MKETNYWFKFVHPISRFTRRRRARKILRLKPDFNGCSVLDVGGSRHYWEKMRGLLEPTDLVLLNIADDHQAVGTEVSDVEVRLYDGQNIPFPSARFDVVICNSVIEHVPPAQRAQLAKEIVRVGKSYFVQTPAIMFPIEPHFVMPFVHWLPRTIARKLVPFGLYNLLNRVTKENLDAYFEEVRLLQLKEFKSYFPDSECHIERLLGIPKSYTIYKIGTRQSETKRSVSARSGSGLADSAQPQSDCLFGCLERRS